MDPLLIIVAICGLGFFLLIAYALRPASEGSSISQRLEGLKAGQQQRPQHGARRIDRSGVACRTSADDDETFAGRWVQRQSNLAIPGVWGDYRRRAWTVGN